MKGKRKRKEREREKEATRSTFEVVDEADANKAKEDEEKEEAKGGSHVDRVILVRSGHVVRVVEPNGSVDVSLDAIGALHHKRQIKKDQEREGEGDKPRQKRRDWRSTECCKTR